MHKPKQVLVVYNPTAKSAAEPDHWLGALVHRLCEESDCIVTIRATRPGLTGQDLLSSTLTQPDLIIAAGGDGTIQFVVTALCEQGSKAPIGIIPVGTGNQLARNLKIYQENLLADPLESALKIILDGHIAAIDLGCMNGQYFTVAAGAGPMSDAVILPGRDDKTNWKMLAYASSMIQTFAMSPVIFKITTESHNFQTAASGVFVSNVSDLGVGKISETADLTDGLLDLCILNPSTTTDYLELGFRLGAGFISGETPYYICKVKTVDIEVLPVHRPFSPLQRFGSAIRKLVSGHADPPPPVLKEVTAMIDGEACGTTPMHIEVVPRAVNILVPLEFLTSQQFTQ